MTFVGPNKPLLSFSRKRDNVYYRDVSLKDLKEV